MEDWIDPIDEKNLKNKFQIALDIENIVAYSFVLLFAVYMIVKYLIIEKKHEITYLVLYYALTVSLAISKICLFIVALTYTGEDIYQDCIADVSKKIGPHFKILIGLIQVAIMVELAIQVKLSARVLTQEEADRKVKNVRLALWLAVAFFSALGIFDVYNTFYMDRVIVPDPEPWHVFIFATIFPCGLVLVSISLTVAYFYLDANIKLHFAKELQEEGKKIRSIFVFFSFSYISRAIVYLLVVFKVISHGAAVFKVMYFFWDVLPLSSLMVYHLKAFRAEEKERKKSVTDWTRQSTGSRAPTTDSEAQSATSEALGVPKFKPTESFKSLFINEAYDEC